MSQGIQVPDGADGTGGAGARAHRIRGSLHLQLGPRALSAVLSAARQKQALGGAIGRAHPAQANGIVALRLRFPDAATSAGRSPARLSQFLRAPSEVSQVQEKESGEAVVSYTAAGADWETDRSMCRRS